MDFVSDWVRVTDVSGVVLARNWLAAPWGFSLVDRREIGFHYVAEGEAWIEARGVTPLRALQGDLVLVPHGAAHVVTSERGGEATPLEQFMTRPPRSRRGPRAILLCGAYRFRWPEGHPLMRGMPKLMHLRASAMRSAPSLSTTLALLSDELDGGQPGGDALVQPLIEALFVYAVRAWAETEGEGASSWVNASRDPAVAGALAAIHAAPSRDWSVESLAKTAGLSRSAFARRFAERMGIPPLTYLLRWRMALAARTLRGSDASVADVAHLVGYQSEFAFSRAFKRVHGMPPREVRASEGANADSARTPDSASADAR
jgi:AraC-like DNA-binding protein